MGSLLKRVRRCTRWPMYLLYIHFQSRSFLRRLLLFLISSQFLTLHVSSQITIRTCYLVYLTEAILQADRATSIHRFTESDCSHTSLHLFVFCSCLCLFFFFFNLEFRTCDTLECMMDNHILIGTIHKGLRCTTALNVLKLCTSLATTKCITWRRVILEKRINNKT